MLRTVLVVGWILTAVANRGVSAESEIPGKPVVTAICDAVEMSARVTGTNRSTSVEVWFINKSSSSVYKVQAGRYTGFGITLVDSSGATLEPTELGKQYLTDDGGYKRFFVQEIKPGEKCGWAGDLRELFALQEGEVYRAEITATLYRSYPSHPFEIQVSIDVDLRN